MSNTRSGIYEIDCSIDGNRIEKLFDPNPLGKSANPIKIGRKNGLLVASSTGRNALITFGKTRMSYGDTDLVILRKNDRDKLIRSPFDIVPSVELERHRSTWNFDLNSTQESGLLRPAQKGAILATLAHWAIKSEAATVVMPTGTGKTETILATICVAAKPHSLIIVPSDALRAQVFERALSWGRLHELGALGGATEQPSVGMLLKGFTSPEAATTFLNLSQVVITTMPLLSSMSDEMLAQLSNVIEFVAVDEAHHLPAKTWSRVTDSFRDKKIVQYTATPFRNDGKHITGNIIFEYPLARCQAEGIFRPIRFHPVTEYLESESDLKIAKTAVSVLRNDLGHGLNHSLMARVSSRQRANMVAGLYSAIAPDLNPVIMYSGMARAEALLSKTELMSGRSRIVICVNMLGEGFDFPSLKIAAVHDPHKSLPVTLQFIGRFTRSGDEDIGDASLIANIALPKIAENLAALYGQDSDWDKLIQGAYDVEVREVVDFQNFLHRFRFDGIEGFSLRNIRPTFTSSVYRMESEVRLESLLTSHNDGQVHRTSLNTSDGIAVVISREDNNVDWGNIKSLVNTVYQCTCIYHDAESGFLFVFSTSKDLPDTLTSAVCESITAFGGRNILRCLHGINRLMLTNVGLKHRLIGPVRYRSYIGPDVAQGMVERATENSTPVMLFGLGYEGGARASIGCSMKGKIWSRNGGSLFDWKQWCRSVAEKLSDGGIDTEKLLEGMLYPEFINTLPESLCPTVADWSDFFFARLFDRTVVEYHEHALEAEDIEFQSVTKIDATRIGFRIGTDDFSIDYCLKLTGTQGGFSVELISAEDCSIAVGKETFTGATYFEKYPPTIWFHDTSCLVDGCFLIEAKDTGEGGLLSLSAIELKDWSSVNIRAESQGSGRQPGTIQYSVAQSLRRTSAFIVFDDDGSGEVADLLAIYDEPDAVVIKLFHLKFSGDDRPGLRVDDVYALCGQAQKAVKWAGSIPKLVEHIRNREGRRLASGLSTRFEVGSLGDLPKLNALVRQKPVIWKAVLVQPGLDGARLCSESDQSRPIRRIFGATAAYLAETYQMSLLLIVSDTRGGF